MTKETKEFLEILIEDKTVDKDYREEAQRCYDEEIKADVLEEFSRTLELHNEYDMNRIKSVLTSENPKIKFIIEFDYRCPKLINKYWNKMDNVVEILREMYEEKENKNEQ